MYTLNNWKTSEITDGQMHSGQMQHSLLLHLQQHRLIMRLNCISFLQETRKVCKSVVVQSAVVGRAVMAEKAGFIQ